jgi:hypothetical protein
VALAALKEFLAGVSLNGPTPLSWSYSIGAPLSTAFTMPEYPQTRLDQRMPDEAFFMCRDGDLAAANCSNKLRQPVTFGIFVALILIFLLGVICGVAGAILALYIPIGK